MWLIQTFGLPPLLFDFWEKCFHLINVNFESLNDKSTSTLINKVFKCSVYFE